MPDNKLDLESRQKSQKLSIPNVRSIKEVVPRNDADEAFWAKWNRGLIRVDLPESPTLTLRRWTIVGSPWDDHETLFFKTLLLIYGKDWRVLSRLLGIPGTKARLERRYLEFGAYLDTPDPSAEPKCFKCGEGRDSFNLVSCSWCSRRLHFYCADPPLNFPPESPDWRCCTTPTTHHCRQHHPLELASSESRKRPTKRTETIPEDELIEYYFVKQLARDMCPECSLEVGLVAPLDRLPMRHSQTRYPLCPFLTLSDPSNLGEHFDTVVRQSDGLIVQSAQRPAVLFDAGESLVRPADSDSTGDYPQSEIRSWIFQINPKHFEIKKALQNFKHIYWHVKQHVDHIQKGDIVYLWVSGKPCGIIAVAEVSSEVRRMPLDPKLHPFVLDNKEILTSQNRVGLKVHKLLRSTLTKEFLAAYPALQDLTILRSSVGTNFQVGTEAAAQLASLLKPNGVSHFEPDSQSLEVCPTCEGEVKGMARSSLHCGTCRQGFHRDCFAEAPPRTRKFFCGKCTGINTKFCKVCDGGQDEDKILMCDSCDEAYHMYCLPQPLRQVPAGTWICPACVLTPNQLSLARLNFVISEIQHESSEILTELAQAASEQYVLLREDMMRSDKERSLEMMQVATDLSRQYLAVCRAAHHSFDAWCEASFSRSFPQPLLTKKILGNQLF